MKSVCRNAGRSDAFRWVKAQADSLLHEASDSAAIAEAHFLLGFADQDVVALAGGAVPDLEPPSRYQAEAAAARDRAVEHLRLGLNLDSTSLWALQAKRDLPVLVQGRTPKGTHFYCFPG